MGLVRPEQGVRNNLPSACYTCSVVETWVAHKALQKLATAWDRKEGRVLGVVPCTLQLGGPWVPVGAACNPMAAADAWHWIGQPVADSAPFLERGSVIG